MCPALLPGGKDSPACLARLASLSPDARRRAEEYRARLERIAHFLRANPSHFEALLWSALKGSRLGVGFRRQVVLGDPTKKLFIVDFCAPFRKLVVEVDDASHEERKSADARRDAALSRLGYRVLRLPIGLVERDFDGALEKIRQAHR